MFKDNPWLKCTVFFIKSKMKKMSFTRKFIVKLIYFISSRGKRFIFDLKKNNGYFVAPENEAIIQEMKRLMGKVDDMVKQRQSLHDELRTKVQKDDITSSLVTHEGSDQEVGEITLHLLSASDAYVRTKKITSSSSNFTLDSFFSQSFEYNKGKMVSLPSIVLI